MGRKNEYLTGRPRALLALAGLVLALPAVAEPTPREQYFVYILNRARHNPYAYGLERELSDLYDELAVIQAQPPLAVNPNLTASARFHAEEMADHDYFAHQSAVTGDHPNKMARDSGYDLPAFYPDDQNWIESIAAGTYIDADEALELLIVDEGVDPPGHRIHLFAMESFFQDHREIGIGHGYNASSTYENYWAIHTAYEAAGDAFLTGVVFDDADGDLRYDIGEGLAGVTVTAGAYSTVTNSAGGWSVKVADGTYTVTASGAGFSGVATAVCAVGGANVEVDFVSGFPNAYVDFESGGDVDGDGMSDAWEVAHFGDLSHDGRGDTDADSLTDLQEYGLGTDPTEADTDADGLTDGDEVNGTPATSPLKPDTDSDGLTDGEEVNTFLTDPTKSDTDGDGLADAEELFPPAPAVPTDPTDPDTDADGLTDGLEVNVYSSDPHAGDTDGDGLTDGEEVTRSPATNPTDADSDDDLLPDGWEVTYELDPLNEDTDGDGVRDPDEDPDQDGYTNLEEQKGGSDPLNAGSIPKENEGLIGFLSCSPAGRAGPAAFLSALAFALLLLKGLAARSRVRDNIRRATAGAA